MMLAVEKHPLADPLNIGTDEEIKIKDLIALIVSLTGRKLRVEYDLTKPSGAIRRCPDISKPKRLIGYQPKVRLAEGLKRTIDWYKQGRAVTV
jgi:nucleoside-diphosphate-sugar epimerase